MHLLSERNWQEFARLLSQNWSHEVKGERSEGANWLSDFTLDPCGMMEKAGEQKTKKGHVFRRSP
jgi:hypothetical protein